MHPELRRIRDHVRFVAHQSCLVYGRQPCDARHLRSASSQCRYAGAIIASSIVMVTRLRGGGRSALIRPLGRARCGFKRIRSAPANWLLVLQIVRGRPGLLQTRRYSIA